MTTQDPSERSPDRRSLERRQADRALQESVERYQSLFESLDCVYLLDFEGRFLDANWTALELLGYEREEILTLSVSSLLDDDQLAVALEVVAELKETGSQKTATEFRVRRKTGEYVDVETKGSVILRDGQPYAVLGVGRDITERKEAEKALRLARLSIDFASDYTLWVSSEGRILDASQSALARLGYSRDELLTMSVFDVTVGLSPDGWPGRWRELKHGPLTFEKRFQTKAGEIFPVEISSTIFEYEGREYNLAVVRDITERKRAEAERLELDRQLQQSQKMESLGILAGGIAHDFNNILTSVLGNAELALSELSPAAPARENLLEITQASRRAAALCRQMLAYSGRGTFVTELIDLSALIEDMLDLLRSTISKKALLNLHLEKNLPLLEGDPSQLGQVIMNLVINASEAIGDKDGVITISTGARECSREYFRQSYASQDLPPGLYLTLEVSDTGCGMDAETQARLFEPFFTTKFTGRGLGLAAVLGIVRGHKGALRVCSEPGKGSTFKIRFPASEAERGTPLLKNGAPAAEWQGVGTVLLVDDEETIRVMGARMLASLGFQVLTAADGRQALALYAEHREEITLVLLDFTMPHMDGEEAFRELRLIDPEVRVVMSSGYTENDITARLAGEGLVGFVQKPYTLAMLAEQLRMALTPLGAIGP